jgi:hypothetical protein
MWICPTCKSKDHLEVVVEIWAKLIQPDDDPEAFETDTDNVQDHDQEWGANSVMQCTNPDCEDCHCHVAAFFDEEDEHYGDKEYHDLRPPAQGAAVV